MRKYWFTFYIPDVDEEYPEPYPQERVQRWERFVDTALVLLVSVHGMASAILAEAYPDGHSGTTAVIIDCDWSDTENRGNIPMAKNQCDGCNRGLFLRDGLHYDHFGKIHMGCTAYRYSRLCAAGCGHTIDHAWAKDHNNLCIVCEGKKSREPFPPAPHTEIPGARTTDNGECNIAY
jgi:hypothetical protein